MEMTTETLLGTTSPFARWEAGELSARDAATAIAQELIAEIEPQEQALEERKKARREELGTFLIRVGEPLEVLGRVTRWVEPTTSEMASVKKLRALAAELRDQGSPALGMELGARPPAGLLQGYGQESLSSGAMRRVGATEAPARNSVAAGNGQPSASADDSRPEQRV